MSILASIVLFENNPLQVAKTIDSVIESNLDVEILLIDNSPSDELSILSERGDRVNYIFNGKNIGYGSAHNIAIRRSMEIGSIYHLVLNPDVYFRGDILENLYEFMEDNKDVGNIMPRVRYPNGDLQYLAKLLPTPVDLFLRRLFKNKRWREKKEETYTLKFTKYDQLMNVPCLSGCFMFMRVSALMKVGIFDESFFMYFEDVDLNRRIHNNFKTIFYPRVEIVHEYSRGSYKNSKHLLFHIKSAIYYFNKWGWAFDSARKKINIDCLMNLKNDQ